MRRTRIVATAGPSTDAPGVVDSLISAGVDVFRLNASHAGPGELASRLAMIREASARVGREVGVLVDLSGPKLRVGEVAENTVLEPGSTFALEADECVGDARHACVSYPGLAADVGAGGRILIDDGRIELEVQQAHADIHRVVTKVVIGGALASHKGVNVPDATLGVESITRYDLTVLQWAMANEVDWIAQSFVRSGRDVEALREFMTRRQIPICAKIEKHEAAERLDEILEAADALMVARGDLGVETSPEEVPLIQRRVVHAARAAGKPVVVATQMLESMTANPRPTRAEASDVANAIFERASAVMLSGETAVGEYPVKAVETMVRIAEVSEPEAASNDPGPGPSDIHNDVQLAVSAAAHELSAGLSLAAIVTISQSGATARAIARHRPETPIIAVVPSAAVARRLTLAWGIESVIVDFPEETGELLAAAAEAVVSAGYAKHGERVALTAGMASVTPGGTDFILIREV